MRYAELLKQALKHPSLSKEGVGKIENALNSINAECDTFSHHIHNAPNIDLIREITRHCTRQIFEIISKYRHPEDEILIRMIVRHEQQGLYAVLNEILKEKSRKSDVEKIPDNSDNHVPKMYSAYRELSMFLHEILEPLKAKEPCRVAGDKSHIWLEYEQDFKNRDEDVNKKIEIERDIARRYAEWHIMNPDYSRPVPPIYTDPFQELKLKSLQRRAPWVFEDIEDFPLYAKETSGLSSILASLDVYYSMVFCEPFIVISGTANFKNVGSVYREIKKLFDENPLCNEIPIFIYTKDELYSIECFKLPGRERSEQLGKLILDLDNLNADDEKDLNCLYTPIFKTKENGYEQYIIIPWLPFELEYEKTIYRHALKHTEEESGDDKLRGAVSRKMEGKIISYFYDFSELPGVIAKNVPKISIGGKDTDFDALLIEEQSNTAILIEYKHSMEFRRSPADAANLLKNLLNNAAKQLKRRLEFIADHPRELEEKLNLPSMILSHVKFLPLIVCNSIEYDRKNFEFKEKVTVNGDVFDAALKISLFELKHAIFQARDESLPLQTIIEAIQKDLFWQDQFSRRGFTRSPSRTTGLKVLYNFAKGSRKKSEAGGCG